MDAKIEAILNGIIAAEGGYVNHPSDRGGPTKYGITMETLANFRRRRVEPGSVKILTEEEARMIYYQRYVLDPGFSAIIPFAPSIAEELIDSGVLSGPMRPTLWLQTALNMFNRQGKLYPELIEDGKLGPVTVETLRASLKARGAEAEKVMVRALNVQQGAFMFSITKGRVQNEDFVYGWFRTRVGV